MGLRVKGYHGSIYSAQKTTPEIIQDLTQLTNSITGILEQRGKVFDILLSLSMILCLISFFLIFIVVGIYLLPLFIIVSLYLMNQNKRCYTLKKNIYRYSLSRKITSLLYRDIEADSSINAHIDFTPSVIKHKKLNKKNHPTHKNWKIINYFDPWLNIQGEFCDHTQFKLNIAEYYRNTSRYKTSRSGKRKWKSKDKFKGMEIKLQLFYSAKKYGAISILKKEAIDAIKLDNVAKLKTFKISPTSMQLKVYLPQKSPKLTYQTVTLMFLSLYQILNLARSLSK